MISRWAVLSFIAFCLISTIGALVYRASAAPRLLVAVVTATPRAFHQVTKTTGLVEGKTYQLTFPGSGQVATLGVHEGDAVRRGQTLATLDVAGLQEQLGLSTGTQAALAQALRAENQSYLLTLSGLKRQTQNAQTQLAANRPLMALGGISAQDFQAFVNAVSLAREQEGLATLTHQQAVITAQRSLLQERQNQQRLQLQLTESSIHSPIDGTVTRIDFRVGEQAGNRQVSIVEDGSMTVRLNVQEGDLNAVKVGQQVDVYVDAFGDHAVAGKIATIGNEASTSNNSGSTVTVRATYDRSTGIARKLIPGLSVRADIHTQDLQRVIVVPTQAVVHDTQGQSLWIITDGTMRKRPITVIGSNPTQVAVSGIQDGSQLVPNPTDNFKVGLHVQAVHGPD